MYLAKETRRDNLKQTVEFLVVKEMSTISHGVRIGEARFNEDRSFRQTVEKVLRSLSHSPMPA